MQAHIVIPVSPQINEAPQPPELQPLWFTAPINKAYVFRTSTTAPTPFRLNTGNKTSCSAPTFNSSWLETTDSPSIPPSWPTTPTSHTNLHLILKRLLNLPKDHNNTKIQTLQAKLDENLENGPVNAETLTIAMDLVLAIFHKESPQHLITKRPDCITVIKRRLELRPWSEALELYWEEGRSNLNNYSSITVWYPSSLFPIFPLISVCPPASSLCGNDGYASPCGFYSFPLFPILVSRSSPVSSIPFMISRLITCIISCRNSKVLLIGVTPAQSYSDR